MELYDFDIGNVFQYRTINTASNGGNQSYHNVIEKYTVIDKWTTNDTIGYIRDGIRQSYTDYDMNSEPVIKQTSDFIDTVFVIDSTFHSLNACDSQLVYLGLENNFYSVIKIDTLNGIPAKRIGGFINGQNNLYQYDLNDSLIEVLGYEYEQIFLRGIGLKRQNQFIFEWSEDIILEGYVFDGDTIGTIWSDSDFIVSINENTKNHTIKVFPTIVTENLINIEHEKEYTDLKIYSIDGRLQSFQSINSKQIRLVNPIAGVYIIRLLYDKCYFTQRIVIQ